MWHRHRPPVLIVGLSAALICAGLYGAIPTGLSRQVYAAVFITAAAVNLATIVSGFRPIVAAGAAAVTSFAAVFRSIAVVLIEDRAWGLSVYAIAVQCLFAAAAWHIAQDLIAAETTAR